MTKEQMVQAITKIAEQFRVNVSFQNNSWKVNCAPGVERNIQGVANAIARITSNRMTKDGLESEIAEKYDTLTPLHEPARTIFQLTHSDQNAYLAKVIAQNFVASARNFSPDVIQAASQEMTR